MKLLSAPSSRARRQPARIPLAVAIATVLSAPAQIHAASAVWTGAGADNSWATAGNWNSSVPGSTSVVNNADVATFSSSSAPFATVTIDPVRYIRSLSFTGTPSAYTIGTTGGPSLLVTSSGNITLDTTVVNAQAINAPLVITPSNATTAATYSFLNNATTPGTILSLGGAISGGNTSAAVTLTLAGTSTSNNEISGVISNGLATTLGLKVVKDGTGTWTLSGANTFTGGVSFGSNNVGTLNINDPKALGTGTFATVNTAAASGGALTIDNTSLNDITLSTNNAVTLNPGLLTFTGTHNLNFGSGDASFVASRTINVNANTLTFGRLVNTGATNQVLTVNGAGTLSLGGFALSNGANRTNILNGSAKIDITGAIVDVISPGTATSSGLTYNGTGTLTLSAANTYHGATTVSSGTVVVASGGSFAADGGALNLNGGTLNLNNAGAYTINTLTVAGGTLNTNATNALGGTAVLVVNSGSAILTSANNYSGATTLNGTSVLKVGSNGSLGTGALNLNGGTIDNIGATTATLANSAVTFGSTASLTFTGSRSLSLGSAPATKSGTLNFTLGSTNGSVLSMGKLLQTGNGAITVNGQGNKISFAGGTTSAGIDTSNRALAFAGSGDIDFTAPILGGANGTTSNGTVTYTGSGSLTLVGGNTYASGTTLNIGTLNFNGDAAVSAGTVLVTGGTLNEGATSPTVGVINGTSALTVRDGRVNLSQVNSYTGVTTVEGGTLIVSGTNSGTTSLVLNGGSTVVDLAAGDDRWNTATVPTFQSGQLTVQGAPSGASSQTLGSPSFNFGQSKITVDPRTGSGTNLTLGNTWAASNSATALIDLSVAGATVTSSPALTNSLVLTGSVVLKDSTGAVGFATRNSNGTGTSLVRYSGATTLPTGTDLSGATNYLQTNGGAVTLAQTTTIQSAYSLQIDSTQTGNSLDLGGKELRLASNSLLFTGTKDYEIKNGQLGQVGMTTTPLRIFQYSEGALTISATLGVGAPVFVKGGPGLVILSGSTLHTGQTTIREGALQVTANQGNLSAGGLSLTGGVLQSSGTFSRAVGSGAGQVRWSETTSATNNVGNGGGFAAKGGAYTIQIGGATTSLDWAGTQSFVQTGKPLIFGSTSADNVVDFQNGLGFTTLPREVKVIDNPNSTADIAKLSGVLSSTSTFGGLVKTGDGRLELSNTANTFTGATTVTSGTLHASANGSMAATSAVTVQNTGTLLLGASGTANVLNNAASVALAGGTLKSGGGSEGTASTVTGGVNNADATNAAGLGFLTLSANSSIDFGNALDADHSLYYFTGVAFANNVTLSITNWASDSFGTNTSGNGDDDRLIFGGLTQSTADTLLSRITFTNGSASYVDLGGGAYEFGTTAIPEPSTVFSLLGIAGLAAFRERRRVRGWLKHQA